MLPEQILIRPVICYCSGKQTHKTDHIQCRCDGWERFRRKEIAPYHPYFIKALNCIDEDGFWLCRYCGKIRSFPQLLVTCPYCDKKFKGPRPYFPVNYECEECG